MSSFHLPDLGEGLTEAEIHEWHVKEGDQVALDQLLVSMETAKAVVEVPSPFRGIIKKLHGKPGDIIATGRLLAEFEMAGNVASAATVVGQIEVGETVLKEAAAGIQVTKAIGAKTTKATPAIRALAKTLQVDLSTATGTGPNGMLTAEDIKTAAASNTQNSSVLHGARRVMARSLAQIHQQVVPVTLVDDADLHTWPGDADITVRLIRAIVSANQAHPELNVHFDGKELEITPRPHIDLGLAVDTPKGLFVPVIKQADCLSSDELRTQINAVKTKAQANNFTPADLKDPSIVLSNFGVFAGRYANPIVVPPSIAIIGIGKVRQQVVAYQGQVVIHPVLPISLTFDHRAATGGEAARFLAAFICALEC